MMALNWGHFCHLQRDTYLLLRFQLSQWDPSMFNSRHDVCVHYLVDTVLGGVVPEILYYNKESLVVP